MSLTLHIPPELQIGSVDVLDARSGAVKRRLQRAIERHFFADPSGTGDAGDDGDTRPRALAAILESFEAALDGLVVRSQDVAAFWAAVLVEPVEAWQRAPMNEKPDTPPRPTDAAFCLALHGICGTLAAERLDWISTETSETDEGADEGDAEPGTREDPADLLWTPHASAVRAVQTALRRTAWKELNKAVGEQAARDKVSRFVATVLVDRLIFLLPDWFEIVQFRKGGPRIIRLLDAALARQIKTFLAEAPFSFSPQPLKRPVRYDIDTPCPADQGGGPGFEIDLIGYRSRNDFLRNVHRPPPDHRPAEFREYVAAVNMQMAVPWRINRSVLGVARHLVAIASDRDEWAAETCGAVANAGLQEEAVQELIDWVHTRFYQPWPGLLRTRYDRPGEFLDHALAKSALDELTADGDGAGDGTFYLPWKADYRGRIYAETPWLTPQGGDVQRALFEFARGRALDQGGEVALRRHGGGLVTTSRVAADLGLGTRTVISLEEREHWVKENEALVLACAENPLGETFWRGGSGTEARTVKKPFQFLAFCMAYRQWRRDPGSALHLPIQIDGTCNGLQHIAALTGDAELAQAVNVLPSDSNLPEDIYSKLAEMARHRLGGADAEPGCAAEGVGFGDRWLGETPARRALLDRDAAKKVVMTIPYGASEKAQAAYVLEQIEETLVREWDETQEKAELDELVSAVREDAEQTNFVKKCARGKFGDYRKRASDGDKVAQRELERLNVLGSYVARALVVHLRVALTEAFPSTELFRKWLGKVSERCAGLPIAWYSPLGFLICQGQFGRGRGTITGRLGNRRVVLDHSKLNTKVRVLAQRSALLPNFIHSLDATHLMSTLLSARRHGIEDVGTIHDCILCHPNDAATFSKLVREQFTHLYAPDADGRPAVLTEWATWMRLVSRIRETERSGAILNALRPAAGTRIDILADEARTDPDAEFAVALRVDVGTLPRASAWLARQLLEFRRDHYEPLKDRRRTPDDPEIDAWALPLEAEAGMSSYFFS